MKLEVLSEISIHWEKVMNFRILCEAEESQILKRTKNVCKIKRVDILFMKHNLLKLDRAIKNIDAEDINSILNNVVLQSCQYYQLLKKLEEM